MTLTAINPADGTEVGRYAELTAEQIDAALAEANAAFAPRCKSPPPKLKTFTKVVSLPEQRLAGSSLQRWKPPANTFKRLLSSGGLMSKRIAGCRRAAPGCTSRNS